tara:strand:- start:59 stop:529 length:471 start_codon:yes stop_codon:yes gene_type:complete
MKGIAYIHTTFCKGNVQFIQTTKNTTTIYVDLVFNLKKTKKGLHGFHIHEFGDIGNQCKQCGSHFNPNNKKHGSLSSLNRHSGDLGNIFVNNKGICRQTIIASDITITPGKSCILGRSIVIHADEDDLGKGHHNSNTFKTGNAGARIGCGVIGLSI